MKDVKRYGAIWAVDVNLRLIRVRGEMGGGYGRCDESSNHMRSVKTVAIPPVWLPAVTQQSQIYTVSETFQKLHLKLSELLGLFCPFCQ